ncbi:beta strand repeat-containing protein [Companilactobacillus sp. HBUAS56257]|uniref:beta strand repeat-containing protein n=1 Tax=Companilactobacillus sp. HBUAS56257 TaxID=3109360 RepID=UPI002FF1E002
MRFQQLKRDPNSIVRKRLVKSKKNWVVLSSLSIAGGLFLLSAPSVTVKADTVSGSNVQTTVVNIKDKSSGNTDTQPITKTGPVENAQTTTTDTKAQTDVPTTDEKTISETKPLTDTKQGTSTSTDNTSKTSDNNTNINDVSTTTDAKTIDTDTTTITDKTLSNLAVSKARLSKLGVNAESLSLNTNSTLADGNIAEGTQGTTPWYISADGILHLGSTIETTKLTDNTTTTTAKTSESSTTGTGPTTSTIVETPTSPWYDNAKDINSIIFDGKVTAADDMNHMFANLTNLKTIQNINNLVTDDTTNTAGMFANDTNLVDASNVGETHSADDQKLDLSKMNWFFVKDTNNMFLNDSSVTKIVFPDSQFATVAAANDVSHMFKNDINLKSVNVANWQFRVPKNMIGLFENDINLGVSEVLDLSTWNMSSDTVTGDSTKGEGMFDGTNMEQIRLSGYNRFQKNTDLPSKNSNHWIDTTNNIKLSTLTAKDDNPTLGSYFVDSMPATRKINLVPTPGETVKTVKATMEIPSNLGPQTVTVTGTVNGAVTSITVPTVNGYHPNITTVNGTIINETTAQTNYYVTYTGDEIDQWNASVTLPDKTVKQITGTSNIDGQTAHIGDTVSFDAPTVTGYETTPTKITGTIQPDKTIKFEEPTYKEKTYTTSVDVPSNLGVQTITVSSVAGKINIPVTKKEGYTADKNSVTGTMNLDGTIILDPDQSVIYTGDNITGNTSITTNLGAKEVTNVSGKVGDTVTVAVPKVDGYTSDKTSVQAKINPDHTITITDSITYTGNNVSDGTATIASNFGNQIVTNITGKVGDTVSIKVPQKDGYTTSSESVQGTIQPDHTVSVKDTLNYIGNNITDTSTTIKTNLGDKVINNISGKVGDAVTLEVPDVLGYSKNKDSISGIINPDGSIKITDNVTYTGNDVTNATATIKAVQNTDTILPDITFNNIAGKVGDIVNLDVPKKDGYTSAKSIKGVINPDGKTVTVIDSVNYIGDTHSDVKAVINSNKGPQYVENVTGQVGKAVELTVPKIEGYDPDVTSVIGIMNPDGSITANKNVTYTPKVLTGGSVTISTPDGKQTITNLTGTVDQKGGTTIKVPSIPGYTSNKSEIKGTMQADGSVITSENVIYTPDTLTNGTTEITIPNGKIIKISHLTGTVDKVGNVQISVPKVTGYTPNKTSVTGTMNADGTVIPDEKITYSPNTLNNGIAEIKTPKGPIKLTGLLGTVGKKDEVVIKVPNITGYTPNKTSITGTMNPDGTVIPSEEVIYTPDTLTGNVIIHTSKGDITLTNVTGTVDQKNGIQIKIPAVPGYTADPTSITATMKPNGSITPSQNITYVPNKLTNGTTEIKTPDGTVKVTNLFGTVDQTGGVTIKVPEVTGYTPDKTSITGTMNPDGTVTPNETVTYIGNSIDNQTLTISAKLGNQTITKTVTNLSGKVGDTIEIKVPQIAGFTTNVSTIKATFNPDGSLSTTDSVIYTSIPQTSPSVTVENIKSTIATFADQPDVQIYAKDSDNQMSIVSRKLVHNSDWLTDQKMTLNGNTFYRVATNEWVKASQVYLYKAETLSLQAKTDSDKQMIKAEGTTLSNLLAKGTQFTSDRIAYINGQEYYRVGINQFVKISDTEIVNDQNINLTVATFSDQPAVQVYALNNDQITPANRKLMPQTDWLVDRQTTIGGQKFYRATTNEWIKASQVYPFVYNQTVVHTTAEKKLYTAQGNLVANRKLNSDSAWKVDRIAYLNDEKYFRVATNEFVKAVDLEKF